MITDARESGSIYSNCPKARAFLVYLIAKGVGRETKYISGFVAVSKVSELEDESVPAQGGRR